MLSFNKIGLLSIVLSVSLLFLRMGNTYCTNYYISSVYGNDNNTGKAPGKPWKTLSKLQSAPIAVGDTLYFACESVFSGGLEITASGTPNFPVVLTSYGIGRVPKFTNPDGAVLGGNAIRLSGDFIVVDGLYFFDCASAPDNDTTYTAIWEVGAVRIMLGADHCTIRNCEFSNCPKGIQSTGEYALITRNYLHSASTRALSYPGWGPIGIQMGNSHQEVCYNVIKDYYSVGGEFGGDGGALELDDGRNPKNDIYIHHNFTSSNMGFLEVSWYADIARAETHDLRIAYNVSDDYQDFVMLWAPTHDTYIENNTIVRRKQIRTSIQPTVFLCEFGGVTIRNNIVEVDSIVTVFINHTGDHDHNHNLYWSVDGSLVKIGTDLHETEIVNADPQFLETTNGEEFSIKSTSPAIDKGISLGGKYTVDFSGAPVPSGNSTDIGAFEVQAIL
jgi:hypothetical protein